MRTSRFGKNFARAKNAWIPRQSKRTEGGRPKGPNATEAKYLREILSHGCDDCRHAIIYQPAPIVITNVTKREYTADFLVATTSANARRPTFHEVKGSYRLPTHERARLAWEIAAEAHPEWDFVWAELTRRGWEIERWESGGRRILVHHAGEGRGEFHAVGADWRRHRPRKSSTWNGKARCR